MTAQLKALSITDAAAARIKKILAESPDPSAVVRLGVDPTGCSGLSYRMSYAAGKEAGDETVEDKGVTLYVDPAAIIYLLGSEIDYVEDRLHAGFVFNNPNEKGRCGCGESFHV